VGCGGGSSAQEEPDAVPTVDPSLEIGSLAVHPGDGALLIGSNVGSFRLPAGASETEKLDPSLDAANQGKGPLIDLVMRFNGPDQVLASGHSKGGSLPQTIGLVSSADGGKTWAPVSGIGDADYHDFEVAGDLVVALRLDDPNSVQVSTDGGKVFEARPAPNAAAALDITIDPSNPKQWAVGTEQGTFLSTNEGKSWRQRDTTAKTRVAWAAADALYSAGLDGKVRLSSDGGKSWNEVGNVGGYPKDLAVGLKGELIAYLPGGKIVRSTDGGKTWTEVLTVAA
jgi:photosystem II stability/assembly factor-like uncharacterized protein